jgi:hypothetical protein
MLAGDSLTQLLRRRDCVPNSAQARMKSAGMKFGNNRKLTLVVAFRPAFAVDSVIPRWLAWALGVKMVCVKVRRYRPIVYQDLLSFLKVCLPLAAVAIGSTALGGDW